MDYASALKLFDLKVGFTEQDLKKSYHLMLKKYHSDQVIHSDENIKKEAETMVRDINAAYPFLLSYARKSFNITFYKEEKIDELKEKGEFPFSRYKDISFDIISLLKAVISLVNSSITSIQCSKTKKEIDTIIDSFTLEFETQLNTIKNKFYEVYGIEEEKVHLSLNYTDNLESFYCSLLKIKKEYSKEALFIKEIDRRLLEYKNFDGYDRIKFVIEKIRINYIEKIRNNINTDIDDFCTEISNSFYRMYDYEGQINDLITICVDIDDDVIKQKLEKLKCEFESIESFSTIQHYIEDLVFDINKYKNEQIIPRYYSTMFSLYTSRLSKLMEFDCLDEAFKTSTIFQRILLLFNRLHNGLGGFEDLKLLFKVSFNNYKQDLAILEEIEFLCVNDIYILNKGDADWRDELFIGKVLEKNEKEVVMLGLNGCFLVISSCLSLDLFKKNYISLDLFLKKSEFFGYNCGSGLFLLYYSDYIYLYFDAFSLNMPFLFEDENLNKRNIVSNNLEVQAFQDKKLLKRKVVEYLEKRLAKWENSEKGKQFKKSRYEINRKG